MNDDLYSTNVHWDNLLERSPCSESSQDGAYCFRQSSAKEFYIWCGGYYYMSTTRGGSQWTLLGQNGALDAIWSDAEDCDAMGIAEWKDVCMEYGAAEEDLECDDFLYCAMDQWQGFLSCDGRNFDYVNGVYSLTCYDDDQMPDVDNNYSQ